MARSRSLHSLALVFIALLVLAQPHRAAPTEDGWLPITPAELALKDNPLNPGAHAILLYREVHRDDVESFETHYYRIKIFTEEGNKYADIQIPYFGKRAQVEGIRARTVRPDGTAAEFHGPIFDKVVVRAKKLKFNAKTFTLPEVQQGSIVEYSYKLNRKAKLPHVLREPSRYIIEGVHSISTASWTIPHELFTRRARFSIRPLPNGRLRWTWMLLPNGKVPKWAPGGTVQLEVENIAAFQEEEHMPPEGMLKGRVDFFYVLGYAGPNEWFWRQQGKQRAKALEKFMGKSKGLKRAVAGILHPDDSAETKLRKLYARVQQIRYLSYERGRTKKERKREQIKKNESVGDILSRGYAEANEINLLFAALARAAGFEASVVELVSRNGGFFRPNLFDADQFNAKVVVVRVDSQDLYFDPATRYCPFTMLPWEETGAGGIRLDEEGGVLVGTPQPVSSEAIVERKGTLELDTEGRLRGQLQVTFMGREALRRRLAALETDEAERSQQLEEEVKGWFPAGTELDIASESGWEDTEAPLRVEFTVNVPNFAVVAGRRLLFPLGAFQLNRKYPFQHAKRVHPVYFRYPWQEVDEVVLRVPAGYEVEGIPPAHETPASFGKYQISCEKVPEGLRLRRRLVVDGYFYRQEHYPALRHFFGKIKAGDEQQAVLQAVEVGQRE